MNIAWVFLGGGIGASLRYLMGVAFSQTQVSLFGKNLPWATLACNLIGCLLLGVITALLLKSPNLESPLRPLLATGVMGGFTTFSTFSLEIVKYQQAGDLTTGLLYALGSIVLGVILCAIGYGLASQ